MLRARDALLCTCLDHVGHSAAQLVSLLDEFRERDIAFGFLEQRIDTSTAEGWIFCRMLVPGL